MKVSKSKKLENPGICRMPELQEYQLVIWLDATTVVRYLYTA